MWSSLLLALFLNTTTNSFVLAPHREAFTKDGLEPSTPIEKTPRDFHPNRLPFTVVGSDTDQSLPDTKSSQMASVTPRHLNDFWKRANPPFSNEKERDDFFKDMEEDVRPAEEVLKTGLKTLKLFDPVPNDPGFNLEDSQYNIYNMLRPLPNPVNFSGTSWLLF